MTILQVDPTHPDPNRLRAASEVIRQGGIIAYPTETVYGLGVDPFNSDAMKKVFDLKGRPAEKSLILLVRGEADLSLLTDEIPEKARILITAFWPGALTLVLRASKKIPAPLLGSGNTIAVRVSSHPVAKILTDLLRGPITSTSANRSGQPSTKSAEEASSIFENRLDLIVDGGPSTGDIPSTVLDLSVSPPALIRPGKIGLAELESIVGSVHSPVRAE